MPQAAFVYDGLGRCVKRTLGGVTRIFSYDGWQPIYEWDASGQFVAWNAYGAGADEILFRGMAGAGHLRYHSDRHGNVTAVLDDSGNVVERYSYDAFGQPTITYNNGTTSTSWNQGSAVGNRFMFQGREYLNEIGLYDFRHRFYDPNLGRFYQSDPTGFDAGDMNLFRYCGNDPVDKSDPMGLYNVIDVTNDFGIRGTVPGSMAGSESPAAQAYHAAVLEELCKFQEVMNSGGGPVTWAADYKEYWGEKDRHFGLKTATSEWETESAAYKDTDGVISHFSEGLHLKTHWNEKAKPEDIRRAQSTDSWYGEIGHIRDATDHGTRRSPGQLDSLRAIANQTANSMIGSRISTQEAAQRMQNALTRWVTETMKNSKDTYDHWPYHVH